MVRVTAGFDALPPIERAGQKIQWMGDDAPLTLPEVSALLAMSHDTFERQGIPYANCGERSRRWLWGTVKAHMKKKETKERNAA